MKVKLPAGRALSSLEYLEWIHERTFELRSPRQTLFDHHEAPLTAVNVVFQVEGRLLSGQGDHGVMRALEDTEIVLTVSSKPVWRAKAAMITPLDSVLEARIASVESMLVHLMKLEAPEGTQEWKLRESMVRLGWKPPEITDNRRLIKPVYIGGCERYSIEVRVPDELPCAFDWMCVLRGTQKLPVA